VQQPWGGGTAGPQGGGGRGGGGGTRGMGEAMGGTGIVAGAGMTEETEVPRGHRRRR
jgi:hypothetical protein